MIDHLWQSTLFVGVIALMMPLFARQRAGLRFWLWFAASLKFLFPFSFLIWLGGFLPALPEHAPLLAAKSLVVTPDLIAADQLMPAMHWLWLVWLVWAAGALFLAVRWLARLWNLQCALRGAPDLTSDLAMESPVPVKAVASFLEPGLVGIFRPVIVMPRGIAQTLSASEMRAVLAHELTHLSRRDNLLASIQMLVELLFWFHPLVWWIGAKLVTERERACDEAVLDTGNAPRTYAEGILKICRFHLQPSLTCAAGVSGGDLKTRVAGIMSNRGSEDADGARILLLGGLGLATLMLPLLAGAPGSAPVNRLARQVASSVLYAPGLPALPQIKFITPAAPHVEPPRIVVAEAMPAPPPAADSALAAEFVIAPVVEKTATVIATKVSAAPPQNSDVFCRKPQRLPGSRLLGPSVCLKISEWEALRAARQDITPDGRATISTAWPVMERSADTNSIKVSAPALPQPDSNEVVCRKPQRLLGSRLLGPSVCLTAGEWETLRAQGQDIGPDGHSVIATNYDKARNYDPPYTCQRMSAGAITGLRGLCF